MEPLKNECIKLEGKLVGAEIKTKKEAVDKINLLLIENVLNDCELIDTLPRERQKQIIDVLIESIHWYDTDEIKNKIKIKFIGTDGEDDQEVELSESMLQMGLSSMTSI